MVARRGDGGTPSVDHTFTPITLRPRHHHDLCPHAGDGRVRLADVAGLRAARRFYGVTGHDYHDRDSQFGFRQLDYEVIQHLPSCARRGPCHFMVSPTRPSSRRTAGAVFPAAVAGRRRRPARLLELALSRSEQPAAARRVAIMVNRYLDTALFYDAGKVTRTGPISTSTV